VHTAPVILAALRIPDPAMPLDVTRIGAVVAVSLVPAFARSRASRPGLTGGVMTARTIPLPSPDLYYPASGVSAVTALRERRSQHEFAAEHLSLTTLATLLNESAGVTELFGRGTPSPGRAYPVSCVVAACAVDGLPSAFYLYDPRAHALSPLAIEADPREWLLGVLANRAIAETEAAHVFAVGDAESAQQHFGENADRFLLLEAGHLIQSMLLVAQHQKIGACAIGKFDRAAAEALLGPATGGGLVLHSAAFGHYSEARVQAPAHRTAA